MSTKKQSKQPTKKQLIETCEELEKGVECVRGFLEQAEEQMKTLSSDGTIPTEGETCLGCRLQGYAEHNHAVFKTCLRENDRLEEEIKKLKEINEDIMKDELEEEVKNDNLEKEIEKLKEEIKELKEENEKLMEAGLWLETQIPDKKGKKLSQKDKQLLKDIFPTVADLAMPGDWVEHCNLLKRLMK